MILQNLFYSGTESTQNWLKLLQIFLLIFFFNFTLHRNSLPIKLILSKINPNRNNNKRQTFAPLKMYRISTTTEAMIIAIIIFHRIRFSRSLFINIHFTITCFTLYPVTAMKRIKYMIKIQFVMPLSILLLLPPDIFYDVIEGNGINYWTIELWNLMCSWWLKKGWMWINRVAWKGVKVVVELKVWIPIMFLKIMFI